ATTVAEEHEHEVLESWQKALDAVRTGDRSWAATHLDWAIKERLFSQVVQRHGIGLDDPAVQRLELAYHDIDPAHSIFQTLQRRGLAPQVLTEERIEAARTVAPATTRAHLRGQVVTAAQEHGVDHVVDWTTLRLTRPGAMPVQVLDPFATSLPEVDSLLAEIRAIDVPARAEAPPPTPHLLRAQPVPGCPRPAPGAPDPKGPRVDPSPLPAVHRPRRDRCPRHGRLQRRLRIGGRHRALRRRRFRRR